LGEKSDKGKGEKGEESKVELLDFKKAERPTDSLDLLAIPEK
jgi:hypothetical protein